MSSNKHYNLSFIIICVFSLIFAIAFAFINILKFKIFSPTLFGWQFIHIYPKLSEGISIFNVYVCPEYAVLFFLFTPINYLIAFIYKFILRAEALYIFQSIIMASAALPIYFLARKRLYSAYLAGAFSIAYLLHPIVTTGAMLGYIPLSLGLPFLLFAFYYLEKENFGKFIFFIILANMSKVDTVVMTLILGLILSFSKAKSKYGKTVVKISSIWLIVTTGLCFIYLKLTAQSFPAPMLHFDRYGSSLIEALRYALNNPSLFIKNLFNLDNMFLYAFYPLPNIFVFLSPLHLLPIIPEIGFILLRNQHSSGHFLILAFIFAGAVYGTEKAINKFFVKYKGIKKELLHKILAVLILIVAFLQHYYVKPKGVFGDKLGPMPFSKNFHFGYYRPTRHSEIGHKLLKKIPSGASCITLQSLAPHLGRCKFLGVLSREVLIRKYKWDYIFVDLLKDDLYHIDRKELLLQLKYFLAEDNYGVVHMEDGWLLARKGYNKNKNAEALIYIMRLLLE
ncbi:DUF2079 domain-containing protein [Patescibacteria group bacterium]|nr:DUF2079 domain-containing protein [Patescibacteria group bacterium]